MSIALEMKVQRLEGTVQKLLERVGDLESELEMLKALPALVTDVPRGTNTLSLKHGQSQKKG